MFFNVIIHGNIFLNNEMKVSWIFLIFLCDAIINAEKSIPYMGQTSELIAVVVLFRHGDRAPLQSWPNDKYFDEKYWPNGLTQLTQKGIRRAHSLGQWFRKRYDAFLSEIYTSKEIYVWSTDLDRTLMTAQAVLNGLYPPKNFQVWNKRIPWQPIPVHTSQRHKDDIVLDKRNCPKFRKLLKEAKKTFYPKLEQQYKDIVQIIREYSGWPTVTLDNVEQFRNQLYVFENYNESFIPNWSKTIYPHPHLHYIANIPLQVPTSTTALARLKIGPFFHKLFCHFENFTCMSPLSKVGPKFLMLSCHDSCLISAMDAMKIFDFRNIGFSDTLIWELKKSKQGHFFMNILYKHQDYNKKLEELKLNECDFNCDYKTFKNIMNDVIIHIDDWEKECYQDITFKNFTTT